MITPLNCHLKLLWEYKCFSVYSRMHKLTPLHIFSTSCPPPPPPLLVFQPRAQRNRLSVWSKLCYAIGGAPYQITGSALGFFLQIYLLDVAQVIDRSHRRQTFCLTGVAT